MLKRTYFEIENAELAVHFVAVQAFDTTHLTAVGIPKTPDLMQLPVKESPRPVSDSAGPPTSVRIFPAIIAAVEPRRVAAV